LSHSIDHSAVDEEETGNPDSVGNVGKAHESPITPAKITMGISVVGVSIFLAYVALKKSSTTMNPQTKDSVVQFGRLVLSAFMDCVLNAKFQ
jgi:hypothetical protein